MDSRKIKVLIVDDNKDFCDIMNEYLDKQEDIEIVGIANDGNEAIELVSQKTPDLIVLDIIMPYLDGIGVLEQMNNMNLSKFPKIIYCIYLSSAPGYFYGMSYRPFNPARCSIEFLGYGWIQFLRNGTQQLYIFYNHCNSFPQI
jgi:hypothetical protein